VQDKAAGSGSSFYYAFLFLPPPRRAAITAFYAFCREVDDVVDEVHDPGVAAPSWPGGARKWRAPSRQPSHPGDAGADAARAGLRIEPAHLLA
jgi:phytoene synthase